MKVIHVSPWSKAFTQFRMPMIQRLQELADEQVIYCPDRDDHYDRLVQSGFEIITGPVSKRFGPSVLGDIRELRRFLRLQAYDALIAHQPLGALVGITAGKLAGVPAKIYSTGGLKFVPDARSVANSLMRIGETRIMKWSDAILLVNKEDRETLEALPVDRSKAHYVGPSGGCGIDTVKFNPRERDRHYAASRHQLGLQPGHFAIGFVGRCVWEKGLKDLARAAQILVRNESRTDLRFCILGSGENLDELKAFVASLGVAEQFVFPGYLPEIHRFVASFDVFVLPSYREGLPVSLLEAQAMGIPSVATNVRGSRELIEHGETGLLVDCHEPAALAGALRKLIDDRNLGERLAASAVDNVHSSYSEEVLVPKTIRIIESTIVNALA